MTYRHGTPRPDQYGVATFVRQLKHDPRSGRSGTYACKDVPSMCPACRRPALTEEQWAALQDLKGRPGPEGELGSGASLFMHLDAALWQLRALPQLLILC